MNTPAASSPASAVCSAVSESYVIVRVNGSQYALAARQVLEILALPALTPIAEAPHDIVGVLNLRSQLVPVMHLGVRLGVAPARCTVQDSVVIIGTADHCLGVVVDAVQEVQALESSWITTTIPYGRPDLAKPAWCAGVANVDDAWVVLLDIPQLIESMTFSPPSALQLEAIREMALTLAPEGVEREEIELGLNLAAEVAEQALDGEGFPQAEMSPTTDATDATDVTDTGEPLAALGFYNRWLQAISEADKAILEERAAQLRQPLEDGTTDTLLPLAIIRLNQEYFGFDLDIVRDFAPVQTVTTIPCCPNHIVGNINLRGEIVTLVDLRYAMHLPPSDHPVRQVMVIAVDEIVAGIPVDEVVDVMYLSAGDLMGVPMTLQSQAYVRGTATYGNHLLSVVDLLELMKSGTLTVQA